MKVHGVSAKSLSELVEAINEWIGQSEKARKLVIEVSYDTVNTAAGIMFTALIIYNG